VGNLVGGVLQFQVLSKVLGCLHNTRDLQGRAQKQKAHRALLSHRAARYRTALAVQKILGAIQRSTYRKRATESSALTPEQPEPTCVTHRGARLGARPPRAAQNAEAPRGGSALRASRNEFFRSIYS